MHGKILSWDYENSKSNNKIKTLIISEEQKEIKVLKLLSRFG